MESRIVAAALAVVLAVCGVTGCAPQPEPSPSATTGFATDAEAFAAAEKTYRLYVDALNQVDLSDPDTFEEVYRWTTGEFNSSERKTLSEMHANGWEVGGESVVTRLDHLSIEPDQEIILGACTDVSAVTLTNSAGESQVDRGRPQVQMTRVELVGDRNSPTGYLISESQGFDLDPPCTVQ